METEPEIHKELSSEQSPSPIDKMAEESNSEGLILEYFAADTSEASIENDTKLHGKPYLMTIALLKEEIVKIIEPCLILDGLSEEVKNYLQSKKNELSALHKNLMEMSSNGKLGPIKYLQVIQKMMTANTNLLHELESTNASRDIDRVKQRLKILEMESQEFHEKARQGKKAMSALCELSKEAENSEQTPPETMTASGYFSKINNLPPQSLAKLMQKRATQYWHLASFINEQIISYLDLEEKAATKQRLETYFYPLVTKASQFVKELEQGVKSSEAAKFFRREMFEMTPAALHGKPLEDRKKDIEDLIQKIEECIKDEEDYINILKSSLDDPDQTSGLNGKKIKETEKTIQKYNGYIEELTKFTSYKFSWVPTPKVGISKEQRVVTLFNGGIPGNSLHVEFKRLSNIDKGFYWIRWGIDTHEGYKVFETEYCDNRTLIFDYDKLVELTSKTKMDPSIENKEIRVEVLYKKFVYFNECKDSEGTIPLAEFRKNNTISSKLKLNGSNAELYYVLKIRQPLNKTSRIEVRTVHDFKLFPPFNKDASSQQNESVSSKVTNSTCPSLIQSKAIPSIGNNIHSETASSVASQGMKRPLVPTFEEVKKEESANPPVNTGTGAGTGIFQKKKYPPLVLLKTDNDPLSLIKEEDLPEGLTIDEVLNPGDPEKIESVTVLRKMAEELEKARESLAYEGRRSENKFVSENWSKAMKKAARLEMMFGEGEVDPLEYVAKLKEVLEKNKKLTEIYEKNQDHDRLAFVKETVRIMEEEIKEIEESMAAP